MLIPYIIYLVFISFFLLVAGMAIWHIHRFATEWGRIRWITVVFIIGSVILVGVSLFLMLRIPWSELY